MLRYAERLSMRCLTVDVLVKIQRDQIQEEALHQVLIILLYIYIIYYIFYIKLVLKYIYIYFLI